MRYRVPRVVGISGPSGAGKTEVAHRLLKLLPATSILMQDWYFKDPELLDDDSNFCDPDTLHAPEFLTAVHDLSAGQAVTAPRIDLRTFRRLPGTRVVRPRETIIVDGMTIFRFREISDRFAHRFYLSPSESVLTLRKLQRDTDTRGRSRDEALKQLHSWILPEYSRDRRELEGHVTFICCDRSVEDVCNDIVQRLRVPTGIVR